MAGHEGNLTGPDLAAGVAADDLAPGASLLGHAHGDPVLLARVDDEYFAIGATCTHYGGPLAEGVIDGDAVRCPWHHACFSLRNGEALHAPALSPVSCYRVERRGDRVVVTGKEERDPLAPTYPTATPPPRHATHRRHRRRRRGWLGGRRDAASLRLQGEDHDRGRGTPLAV